MKGQDDTLSHVPTARIPAALPGKWVRPAACDANGCIEVFDEQDGNWRIRSSFNRDREIRLTREEVSQLVGVALFGKVAPAPEKVGEPC